MQESFFSQYPLIALSSKTCQPSYCSPSLLGACCLEVSGGKPCRILWREGKAHVLGSRHACRSAECPGKRLLFLLDNMALVLGASKGRGRSPNLNHTSREICVISLATFTIPVCRWIASEDNPADEASRSKRCRPSMHSDVDQCGPSATGSAPDSELLAVLSAEAARVASEEAQARKRSRGRFCAGVADQNR